MSLNLNFKVPVVEVITPITNKKVLMKPLTLAIQDYILSSSITTFSSRMDAILKIIWDRVQNKEVYGGTYESFLSQLFMPDMQILVYGILSATYGNEPLKVTFQCGYCGEKSQYDVIVPELLSQFKINENNTDNIEELKKLGERVVTDERLGLTFYTKYYTMDEVLKVINNYEQMSPQNLSRSSRIDDFETLTVVMGAFYLPLLIGKIEDKDGNILEIDINKMPLNEFIEVVETVFKELPPNTIEKITDVYPVDYMPKFETKFLCSNPKCEAFRKRIMQKVEVDIMNLFFHATA